MGWKIGPKSCTCLCDHPHTGRGCTIDFLEPATGWLVYYSNLKWDHALSDHSHKDVTALNRLAFA